MKIYSLTVCWNGVWKAFPQHLCHMSEMNSVSDLMATWAKFTLRGDLLGEITVTEMVSWERLLVRFNFFFFWGMLSLCLLNGHFIALGQSDLKPCVTTMDTAWMFRETQAVEAQEGDVRGTFVWIAVSALESVLGKPTTSTGPGGPFQTQHSLTSPVKSVFISKPNPQVICMHVRFGGASFWDPTVSWWPSTPCHGFTFSFSLFVFRISPF